MKKEEEEKQRKIDLEIKEEDLEYEQIILSEPLEIKSWWYYLEFKKKQPETTQRQINIIYERALKQMPYSYKLWWHYIENRKRQVGQGCYAQKGTKERKKAEAILQVYERSLTYMNKMPRIWLDYAAYLYKMGNITRTRKTFDAALQALPLSQHKLIWKAYIEYIKDEKIPLKIQKYVMKRYCQLKPEAMEKYIDFLIEKEEIGEGLMALMDYVNDDTKVMKNRSRYEIWQMICDIIAQYPQEIKKCDTIKVDNVIKSGMKQFKGVETGKLWNALATYYMKLGYFDRARDIYEEAMKKVTSVRDFIIVYEAYTKTEESLVLATANENHMLDETVLTMEEQGNLSIARYQSLIERHDILKNRVKLRQNPHNIEEWLRCVQLAGDDTKKILDIYSEAIDKIHPKKATGGDITLVWKNFSEVYENKLNQIDEARAVYGRAMSYRFYAHYDELVTIYRLAIELEIRNHQLKRAHDILTAVLLKRIHFYTQETLKSFSSRLYTSPILWGLYCDLDIAIGTLSSVRKLYKQVINLKVATVPMILAYGNVLWKNHFFEDAFRTFENGIQLFSYPQSYHIWIVYLTRFVQRYRGTKIERARELFEDATKNVPRQFAKLIYLLYAKFEEQYGWIQHAMKIYERALSAVKDDDLYEVYSIYLNHATEYYGIAKTRPIYETAIRNLPIAREIVKMGLRFIEIEKQLGDIPRARGIFTHISKFCNPETESDFWHQFEVFETEKGSLDSFKEMVRLKKLVSASFVTSHFVKSQQHKRQQAKRERVRKRPEEISE